MIGPAFFMRESMVRSSDISRLQGAPTGMSIVVGALRKRDCLDCLEVAEAVRSYRCLVVRRSASQARFECETSLYLRPDQQAVINRHFVVGLQG